jgi:chemotaxis protein MotB
MATAASQALQQVADQVEQAMDDLVKDNLVVVRRSDFWIEVEIKADILFPSGSAHLGTNASSVIERLAASLAPFPNPVRVEGYTDNLPIKNLQFYSNWELSAARAGSVVRVLSGHGVDPGRLAVIGYGEQRPIQSNDTAQGRNANRRVVIVILSTQLQHKQDDSELPAATAANAAASAAAEGGNVPGPLSSDPTPSGVPPTVPTQAGEVAIPAALAVPGEPATPPSRTVPDTRTTPTPIGQPALPGRPAPAPQAVPAVRGTGPSTTFNTGSRAPAMQHAMQRMA